MRAIKTYLAAQPLGFFDVELRVPWLEAIGLINLIYPPVELRAGNLAHYEQIVRLKLLTRAA